MIELASELESDLLVTVNWGRMWLVDFSAGETQLVSFDRMGRSVLKEKSSISMLGLSSLLN